VRFAKPDGQVVDVLWSVEPAPVKLPSRSARVVVTDRDGGTRTVDAHPTAYLFR
jgi:hypothetical protein